MSRPRSFVVFQKKVSDTTDTVTEDDPFFQKIHAKASYHPEDQLNLKVPKFSGCKKTFPSLSKKPIQIHEKAKIIGNFDRLPVEDIDSHTQMIDWDSLLYQFKNEDEVRNLEIVDLINVDYELLAELKNKAIEFIDATTILLEEKKTKNEDTQSETALVHFLTEKYQEMMNNEINLQIFINNLENVKALSYSNDGVKIFFKMPSNGNI